MIATAGAATAAAFLVLLLSPVPMVRGFGALLVIGIVIAFAVTLTAGFAVLGGDRAGFCAALSLPAVSGAAQAASRAGPVPAHALPVRQAHRKGTCAPPARWVASFVKFVRDGTRGLVAEAKLVPPLVKRWGGGAFGVAVRRPGRVLRVALLLAVVGWVAGTQVEVVSDITRLVPGDQREVRDLKTLQREAGTPGDVNVRRALGAAARPGCRAVDDAVSVRGPAPARLQRGATLLQAELCPALSLTNLFGSGRQSARQVEQVIEALPRYFSQNVITADRRTANIAFGIRTMPLDEQKELVDDMRAQLDPPRGVDARARRAAGAGRGCPRGARGESLVASARRPRGGVRSCCWPPTGASRRRRCR